MLLLTLLIFRLLNFCPEAKNIFDEIKCDFTGFGTNLIETTDTLSFNRIRLEAYAANKLAPVSGMEVSVYEMLNAGNRPNTSATLFHKPTSREFFNVNLIHWRHLANEYELFLLSGPDTTLPEINATTLSRLPIRLVLTFYLS